MNLRIRVPTEALLDTPVTRVVAEAHSGSFCLLPRHLDLVTVLVPGLLSYTRPDGSEGVVVVDHGLLTKVGSHIEVVCQRALVAADVAGAMAALRAQMEQRSEREKRARTTLARLEVDVVRQLGELRGQHAR